MTKLSNYIEYIVLIILIALIAFELVPEKDVILFLFIMRFFDLIVRDVQKRIISIHGEFLSTLAGTVKQIMAREVRRQKKSQK